MHIELVKASIYIQPTHDYLGMNAYVLFRIEKYIVVTSPCMYDVLGIIEPKPEIRRIITYRYKA